MVIGGDGYQVLKARLPQELVVHQLVHHLGLGLISFAQQGVQEKGGPKQAKGKKGWRASKVRQRKNASRATKKTGRASKLTQNKQSKQPKNAKAITANFKPRGPEEGHAAAKN